MSADGLIRCHTILNGNITKYETKNRDRVYLVQNDYLMELFMRPHMSSRDVRYTLSVIVWLLAHWKSTCGIPVPWWYSILSGYDVWAVGTIPLLLLAMYGNRGFPTDNNYWYSNIWGVSDQTPKGRLVLHRAMYLCRYFSLSLAQLSFHSDRGLPPRHLFVISSWVWIRNLQNLVPNWRPGSNQTLLKVSEQSAS